tara:strand:+ start:14 stop:211 length:198 start_codon:yes stop_codon:yes gene_type:complete
LYQGSQRGNQMSKQALDYVVVNLVRIIRPGGAECSYAINQILDIIHTLENDYDYEVPNVAHLEEE